MGLLSVARLARNSWSFVRRPSIRPTGFCERLGAPRFRKICFSCATENVVAQATRSRCCTDVRFGFDSFCSAAVKCECRSSGEARKIRARSGTVDLRYAYAVGDDVVVRGEAVSFPYSFQRHLFAESLAELCARIFAVELRDKTRADLGGTHCFALVSVGAITKSLFIHYLHHFQHTSLTFRRALRQK